MTLCGLRRRVSARTARSPRRHIASARTAVTTTRDRSGPSTKNRTYTAARLCWTPSANRWLGSRPVLPRPNDANITSTSEFGSKTLQIRIAVDAMGGDHAPSVVVEGAVAAARHLDAGIDLVGRTADIERALSVYPDWRSLGIGVIDAPEVIEMAESPASAVRRKPHSSVRVAADLVARRQAAALVSAGHTGATVLSAHAAFGMVAGVDRPALATTIPTRRHPAVLLDAGANVECRPQHLLQFAVMGSVYARLAHGVDEPRVGLLSIGEEESKGNELTREAHRLLKAIVAPLHRQRRGAGDLQRRGRRGRLRWLHRQHRVEDERRARRDRRSAAR